jgi:hypothetical protein
MKAIQINRLLANTDYPPGAAHLWTSHRWQPRESRRLAHKQARWMDLQPSSPRLKLPRSHHRQFGARYRCGHEPLTVCGNGSTLHTYRPYKYENAHLAMASFWARDTRKYFAKIVLLILISLGAFF